MGKVINNALVKHDGPPNKWNQIPVLTGEQRQEHGIERGAGAAAASRDDAALSHTALQMDDGNQDMADMHEREDLLLDHYTWVNQQQGTVRIPIGQAMQIIAQRGLPVVQGGPTEPLMTADVAAARDWPLTNGFARTGYEQEMEVEQSRNSRTQAQGSKAR